MGQGYSRHQHAEGADLPPVSLEPQSDVLVAFCIRPLPTLPDSLGQDHFTCPEGTVIMPVHKQQLSAQSKHFMQLLQERPAGHFEVATMSGAMPVLEVAVKGPAALGAAEPFMQLIQGSGVSDDLAGDTGLLLEVRVDCMAYGRMVD